VETGKGGVRVLITTPPSGRQARVRSAQRARWERLAVSRSEALSKYQEARLMQAEIKRANAAQQRSR
jgi:hypothetical protein